MLLSTHSEHHGFGKHKRCSFALDAHLRFKVAYRTHKQAISNWMNNKTQRNDVEPQSHSLFHITLHIHFTSPTKKMAEINVEEHAITCDHNIIGMSIANTKNICAHTTACRGTNEIVDGDWNFGSLEKRSFTHKVCNEWWNKINRASQWVSIQTSGLWSSMKSLIKLSRHAPMRVPPYFFVISAMVDARGTIYVCMQDQSRWMNEWNESSNSSQVISYLSWIHVSECDANLDHANAFASCISARADHVIRSHSQI